MSRFVSVLVTVCGWLAITSGLPVSAVTPPSGPSSQSHYERPSAKGGPYKQRVVVFVHGIFGDADATWRYSASVYWPKLLLTDDSFRDSDVYVAGYSTPYLGNTMNVDEVVTNLNNRLVSDEVFSKHREVVFVCHSLGGLIVQRLLLTFRGYAKQVPFIYFFSTPETGAQIAKLAGVFSADPLLRALLPSDENGYLQNLENEWKASQFHIRRLCAYEKKPYKGVLVVDRLSGTRNCDDPPIAINEDHIGIVKPSSADHDSYIALRNAFIAIPISRNRVPSLNGVKGKNTSPGDNGQTEASAASPAAKDNLREQGLALFKEILDFLADRQRNDAHTQLAPSESGASEGGTGRNANLTPKYMQETLILFGEKFESRIADIHDELSSRGLQDLTLDALYRDPAHNIFGNVDRAIREIADSIRRLVLLVPPEGMYKDVSDGQLTRIALDEANKMDKKTTHAMKELSADSTPDAVRFFFWSDFRSCCLNQVEYLRAELMKRLGPSAYDTAEMRAFNGSGGLAEMEKNPNGSIAAVLDYSPYFRHLAIRLKRRADPSSGQPRVLDYSETLGTAGLTVTIETQNDIASGYIFVQFESSGSVVAMKCDLADSKYVSESDATDNADLLRSIRSSAGEKRSTLVVKVGDTPFRAHTPIHVVAYGASHASKVLYFDE